MRLYRRWARWSRAVSLRGTFPGLGLNRQDPRPISKSPVWWSFHCGFLHLGKGLGTKEPMNAWEDMEGCRRSLGFHLCFKNIIVQSLSHVWLFVTPWTAACQASLSLTVSQSWLKLMSIESMMPSNHLILCPQLCSCHQSFPASGSFPNESSLHHKVEITHW